MNLALTGLNKLENSFDKNFNQGFTQNYNKKYTISFIKMIAVVMASLCLCACQTTSNTPSKVVALNTVNFGQYYLALKNLSYAELENEIQQQQLKKSEGSIEAEINLILLHSLSNSPIYNVYTAKSKLNEQLKLHQNYYLSSDDQAFIYLLKDQLNQQLYLFQQVINQQLEHDADISKNSISEKKQLNKIAALELTVKQLTEKIIQLKKIEQTISEHGQ